MSKEIIITGVAGFIGYSLSKRLLDLGYKIIGIDNLSSSYSVKLKEKRLEILKYYGDQFIFYKKDIRDLTFIESLSKKHSPERIIHLAAEASVISDVSISDMMSTNIVGFSNILELCKNTKSSLTFASSNAVYGNNPSKVYSEDQNTDTPISVYAATKKSNENLAYTYSYLHKIPIIGLRFFTVYGPWGRPNTAPSIFTKNILNDVSITLYNKGNMSRDYVYIEDVVDGILTTFNYSGLNKEVPYDVFNIGSGKETSLNTLVNFIELYCDKKAIVTLKDVIAGDVLHTYANVSKSKRLLGFSTKVELADGLRSLVDWFKVFNGKINK